MDDYFPTVVQAVPGEGRCVYAYFDNGAIRLFDTSTLIREGTVFERLADESFFRDSITVMNGTVAWDVSGVFDPTMCIDIDPFVLYEAENVADPLERAG